MASGNTLLIWTPAHSFPPSSNYATFNSRNAHLLLDFDKDTAESIFFAGTLPRNYASGGITLTLVWIAAASATTGDVVWGASWERHQASTTDLDSDDFAAEQTATSTTASTNGAPVYPTIAFTHGAQIDSLAVGESFRLKIRRVAADAGDTLAVDAELLRVEARET